MADRVKRLRKGYCLRRRHLATSIKERKDAAQLLQLIFELHDSIDDESDDDEQEDLEDFVMELTMIWENMVFEKPFDVTKPRPIRLAFDFLIDENVAHHYRYRTVEDLRRVYVCLQIPETCGPLNNGSYIRGEQLFLFYL